MSPLDIYTFTNRMCISRDCHWSTDAYLLHPPHGSFRPDSITMDTQSLLVIRDNSQSTAILMETCDEEFCSQYCKDPSLHNIFYAVWYFSLNIRQMPKPALESVIAASCFALWPATWLFRFTHCSPSFIYVCHQSTACPSWCLPCEHIDVFSLRDHIWT